MGVVFAGRTEITTHRSRSSIPVGVARHDEGRGPAVLCGDVPSVCAVSVRRLTLTVVDGEAIEDDSDQVTAEDVAYFNREAMRDLAVKGRIAGLAVMIIGVVGGLAWLWVT